MLNSVARSTDTDSAVLQLRNCGPGKISVMALGVCHNDLG